MVYPFKPRPCVRGSTVPRKSSSLCSREHRLFEPAAHAREVRLLAGEGGLELCRHLRVPELPGEVNEQSPSFVVCQLGRQDC